MKEFMLLIRNTTDSKSQFSVDEHLAFVKSCEVYIDKLKERGQLLAAQPLSTKEGKIIANKNGAWQEGPYNETTEVQVGYYHVLAKDIEEAIEIAKSNPEFAYTSTARIEVRPIKMKEESTGYTYPTQ